MNKTSSELPFPSPSLETYSYGFNGKEKMDELHGNSGDAYDYGMRFYDARIGRPFSPDPLFRQYQELSPYQFFTNNPILKIDIDGLEGVPYKKNSGGFGTNAQSTLYRPTLTEVEINQMKVTVSVNNNYAPPPMMLSQDGMLATPEYKMFKYNLDLYGDWVMPLEATKKLMAGEELTYAEMGIAGLSLIPGERILGKAASLLKGVGGEVLEKFVTKFENQAAHLTEKDIAGAVKDIFGTPVKIGDKTFNHIKEVEDALSGVGQQLNNLNKAIEGGKFSDDVLESAKKLRSTLQKQKDAITDYLGKAKKEAAEVKKIEGSE